MRIALINSNRIFPPIGPIGLEYVAESLDRAGHTPEVLDLCWEKDIGSAVERFFDRREFELIGLTIRNTDDCAFGSKQSFLDEHRRIVDLLRKVSNAPVILGGVGFSVMPEQVLKKLEADAGVWGDGESVFPLVAECVARKQKWRSVPNLVYRDASKWARGKTLFRPLEDLPPMSRGWVDNRRYYEEGGQAGFESKRGCTGRCIYCADPVAKGTHIRVRPPAAVTFELRKLMERGILHFHTCDSEFNIPLSHSLALCEEINTQKLNDRIQWYTYCAPVPFSRRFARLLRRAGCVGINFGSDSGDDFMLKRLGRDHTSEDIAKAVRDCKEEGIAVMIDLLLGSPEESEESIKKTIELMKRIQPDCVGISTGVRVYPGTPFYKMVSHSRRLRQGIVGDSEREEPLFFVEPMVASGIFELLEKEIKGDKRFFFLNPSRPETNYNYNSNLILVQSIQKGARGAYWDILRRREE
jgi:radical SAM superfamily enzyme YgiQ (UPF0313 family)